MAVGKRGSRRSGAAKARQARNIAIQDASPASGESSTTAESPRGLPQEDDILVAIESLYDDEMKPFGRIIRKRLCELSVDGNPACGADAELRAVCSAMPQLRVDSCSGGEWCALLLTRPPCFVDVYDTEDVYNRALWDGLAAYLDTPSCSGGGAELQLPGGRYMCAQALARLHLPFLEGLSLGQICHVVQLGISTRKLLGYLDGSVVPHARCALVVKKECAQRGEPSGQAGDFPPADWSVARRYVHAILQKALDKGDQQVPLSNIKRFFRSVYQLDLSETALGHTRLSGLLADPVFSDICIVELQENGYMVRPAFESGTELKRISMPELLEDRGTTPKFCPNEPLCLEDALESEECCLVTPSPYPNLLETGSLSGLAAPLCSAPQYLPHVQSRENCHPCPPPAHEPGMMRAPELFSVQLGPARCAPSAARKALQEKGDGVLHALLSLLPPEGSCHMCDAGDPCLPGEIAEPLHASCEQFLVFCPNEPLCLEDALFAREDILDIPVLTPTPVITSAFSNAILA